MKLRLSIALGCLMILTALGARRVEAFAYFGGQVTNWQEQNACPAITAANSFLDSICGITAGTLCLNLNYGTLTFKGGFAVPNALNAKFDKTSQLGVLSISDPIVPLPLHFYQSFLAYGFTQTNAWVMGEALDFTPSCNPCGNDLEKAVLSKAGIDMDKYCSNTIVKASLSLATATCNAALAAATTAAAPSCPTKVLCFVGASHFGLPGVEYNLCHPGFSVGGLPI